MSKLRAFSIHLAISAAIVGFAITIIFLAWYPSPYFRVIDAWKVVGVFIGVGLVVGPLPTLIVFRSGKPGLVFDLCVIALIQVCALVYGLTIIYSERPYYVVFAVDRFEVLARKDVDESQIKDDRLQHKPWAEPIYAVASLPDSLEARQRLIDEVIQGKPDIERRPEFWSPYDDKSDEVLNAATPLTEFRERRPDALDLAERVIAAHPNGSELVGVPVIGKQSAYVIVLEPEQRKPVGVLPVDPWRGRTSASH
jgi:hypothetical protein